MYKHILVPVDLNEQGFADKAVQLAVWHAKHSNAEIHLLNVLPLAFTCPWWRLIFPKTRPRR